MSNLNNVTHYFGNKISGYVANKFLLTMSGFGFGDLTYYARKVTLPYATLNTIDDIYVSDITLARPKLVTSVQTHSEIGITFRMDPENKIILALESIYGANHSLSTFEAVADNSTFTLRVAPYNSTGEEINVYNYYNCEIYEMSSYDLDNADRKLKEYDIKILCNRISNQKDGSVKSGYYSSKSANTYATNCNKLSQAITDALKKFANLCNGVGENDRLGRTTSGSYHTVDGPTAMQYGNESNLFVAAGQAYGANHPCAKLPQISFHDALTPDAKKEIINYLKTKCKVPDSGIGNN